MNRLLQTIKVFEKLKTTIQLKYLFAFVMLLAFQSVLYTQDDTPYRSRVSLNCTQLIDNQVDLIAKVRAKVGKSYVAVTNAEVEFYTSNDSTEIMLGKTTTNKNGEAILSVNSKNVLSLNEDGYYNVVAKYNGDDTHKPDDNDLLFKPAFLELVAEEVDSVNTIILKLNTGEQEAEALDELEVNIQIPRMFSNLTIATEALDEEGKLEFEFPNDIPGKENGELTIIASIEETDEYGTIKNEIIKNWGTIVNNGHENDSERALWSPNAPLWMVLTFALLISLVWTHFLIIVYKLFLIKKEGNTLS